MRVPSLFFASFVVATSCLGCGKAAAPVSIAAVEVAQAPAPADKVEAVDNIAQTTANAFRKIIYTSRIEVTVENFSVAKQRLTTLVESLHAQGGFLANQEISGVTSSNRRGVWTVRVPLSQFDSFLTELEKLGDVQRNSRDAQDVTEAYVDLEARLRNKRASEQRLISHLETSSVLKDTLELEREISRVRAEVEQMQGQLNALKSKTDLATVSVTIIERPVAAALMAEVPFIEKISKTFLDSLLLLSKFCQIVLLVAAAFTPWIVAASLLMLPVWLIGHSGMLSVRRKPAN